MARRRSPGAALARSAALVTVGLLIAAGVVLSRLPTRPAPHAVIQSSAVAARAAPARSESSNWFCTGGSGHATPVAQARLLLVNTGGRAVVGTLRVTDTRGRTATAAVRVPARGQSEAVPADLVPGDWLATRVDVAGGAVSAEEVVQSPDGWSAAPCASETSSRWYFAGGSTAAHDTLRVALYNPNATLAVVDLSFVTSSGVSAPAPYQGMVVGPDRLETVTVGRFVQNQASVATIVSARSGAVVATELERNVGGGSAGLALWLGSPAASRDWLVPRATDPIGGSSQLSVLNPSPGPVHVRVDLRLASGPVAPFEQVVGPGSLWTLATSTQLRVPPGTHYAARVSAAGGAVVVEREEALTPGAPTPQWGALTPTPAVITAARRWVLPAVGTSPSAPTPIVLALVNPGRRKVVVTVSTLRRGTLRRTARVTLGPHQFASIESGQGPLLVTAGRPVAVAGDASGHGAAGLLGVPAVPQA